MFNKKFEDRLAIWSDFRNSLSHSDDPIQDTIDFFNNAPLVSIATDPWDKNTWPTPWQIIQENNYCEFVKLLAICYTLQLSDCLTDTPFEIYIASNDNNRYYLLYVNDLVIGYEYDKYVNKNSIKNVKIETKYVMPSIQ